MLPTIATIILAVIMEAITISVSTELISIPEDMNSTEYLQKQCLDLKPIPHASITWMTAGDDEFLGIIKCNNGYSSNGRSTIHCVHGMRVFEPTPECYKTCPPPPKIHNGLVEVDNLAQNALYKCSKDYYLVPNEIQYKICENGSWTGPNFTCQPQTVYNGCPAPKDIINGYYVPEIQGEFDDFVVGQRLHYNCRNGLDLIGTTVQQCLRDGTWSPKIPPVCSQSPASDELCSVAPKVPNSYTNLVEGYQSETLAISGTVIQIHCFSKFRNSRAPCKPGKLRCVGGRWVGSAPICVPVHDCEPPPLIPHAVIYSLPEIFEYSHGHRYPVKSEISYQCIPGYILQGDALFTCTPGGCWTPSELPFCKPQTIPSVEVDGINAILISGATGAGVLGLLLVICLITVWKRRKPLSRAVPIPPPVQRPDLGDHATLLHHPDRLALIAFADGMQNDQTYLSSLPTYDEAIRDQPPNYASLRLHRPYCPNLGGRRLRNTANPNEMIHVPRHGSFVSHTPSTRSTGDSMGSTDTVAVSEGSTNITLDTASSYSGSQPASCRGHCGSLASFDTSSIVNTEGVPLLEENELEESHGGDNISLVVDYPLIADNASYKLSTNSTDFP